MSVYNFHTRLEKLKAFIPNLCHNVIFEESLSHPRPIIAFVLAEKTIFFHTYFGYL